MAVGDPIVLMAKADGPSMQQNLADIEMAKNICEILMKHYPGHSWAANVDGHGGIATIKNFNLSGDWGFVLHLKDFFSDSWMQRLVIQAAGELLERYRLSRGGFNQAEYEDLERTDTGEFAFSN